MYRPEFLKPDLPVHDSTARLPSWTMSDESAPWRLKLAGDLLPTFILDFYYRDHSVSFFKYLVPFLFTFPPKQEARRISHVGLDICMGQDSLPSSSSLLACISMLPVKLLNFWHKGCTCEKIPSDLYNRTAVFLKNDKVVTDGELLTKSQTCILFSMKRILFILLFFSL